MNSQVPLRYDVAGPALLHCVAGTADLLAHHRIHLPSEHVGVRLRFADGSSARVYRETVVEGGPPTNPCALVVGFRLRVVRGWGHTVFRWESLLNTPLFVGFPGFVSKLWLANDERGRYRGIYEWDGPERAEHYARSLWRVLALGCGPDSICYRVLPDVRRDDLLQAPHQAEAATPGAAAAWWRPVEAT